MEGDATMQDSKTATSHVAAPEPHDAPAENVVRNGEHGSGVSTKQSIAKNATADDGSRRNVSSAAEQLTASRVKNDRPTHNIANSSATADLVSDTTPLDNAGTDSTTAHDTAPEGSRSTAPADTGSPASASALQLGELKNNMFNVGGKFVQNNHGVIENNGKGLGLGAATTNNMGSMEVGTLRDQESGPYLKLVPRTVFYILYGTKP